MRAIGLMSGTSLDGIDIALIETDGVKVTAFGPAATHPYRDDERTVLRQALAEARELSDRTARPGILRAAEEMLTTLHAGAVQVFCDANEVPRASVDVIGFHGQTVLHRPERRLTVQLGNGPALAAALGLPVVYDFRAADVAAGGQGAPLVPAYHRALVARGNGNGVWPVAVLNIGGVANITYIAGDHLIACDTGPGNALLDDFMARRTGEAMDRDGQAAARGRADAAWLAQALAHPFFAAPPPKSLDRNDFAHLAVDGLATDDGAATLTALTAQAVARVVPLLPKAPAQWIVVGGGARNPVMLRELAAMLAPARVAPGGAFAWNSDAVEAQAFAFLAVRSLKGLPLTYPGTTGVREPLTGGVCARP